MPKTRPRTHTQTTAVLPQSWQLTELPVLPPLNPSSSSTPITTKARWHRPDLRRMVPVRRRLHLLMTALSRRLRLRVLLELDRVVTAASHRRLACDGEVERMR